MAEQTSDSKPVAKWPAEARALVWASLITAVFSFLGTAVTLIGNAVEKKKANQEAVLLPETPANAKSATDASRGGAEVKDSVAVPARVEDPSEITSAGFSNLYFSALDPEDPESELFEAPSEGLLFIVANAQAEGGEAFRSYLDLRIMADGKICGQTRTYLPTDWRVGHLLNAACILPVVSGQSLKLKLGVEAEGVKADSVSVYGKYAFVGRQ
jgi:hypothetical protein